MEFRVLGPLEVRRTDGETVDLGGPRQQIVLAVLLLESPHVVSVDRLVDAVWPDSPPATARSQIQICVSSLRQRLRSDTRSEVITTRRPGYLLRTGSAAFDRQTFTTEVALARDHVQHDRLDDAAELFRSALARWRGTALPGIDSLAVRDAATHLEEERARVVEELADVQLRMGNHRDLVAVLTKEIDRYPLREELRGQLMLALYGAGRQADALREFRRARALSIEELGIEPAEPLRRLEQAILREDDSLVVGGAGRRSEPPPPQAGTAPRMLPAEVADFTGRTRAIAEVLATLAATRDSETTSAPAVVVLTGQGGIGKSALALHIAHRLADRFPDGQLYASLHGASRPVAPAEVIARFLRALGVPGGTIPDDLDERAELYRSRLSGRSVVIVLDDVGQEAQVLPLLPPDRGSAVLLTSRRRLTALPGAERVELESFTTESAVTLLDRVIGGTRIADDRAAAVELVRLCGHLPLAVRIAAARLAARPHWSLRTMVERLSDETIQLDELRHGDMAVRASLLLTYEALGPQACRLLRLLAMVDAPHVGAWACAALLDVDHRTAEDQLDELVELHLVDIEIDPDGDVGGTRYHLHDLVRLFARERAVAEDPAPERAAAVARYLGAMLGLAEEAHRREYGGDFLIVHGDARRHPLDDRLRTSLMAQPLLWLARERQALVAAVAQASAAGLGSLCWDLAISSVVLFEAHALFDDWRATHDLGLAAARRDQDRLGEAVMTYSLGSLHMFEQRFAEAEVCLDDALTAFTALGNDEGRAMVVRNQAFVDRVTARYSRARARNEQALEIFRATGDRAGEAYVLSNLAQVDLDIGCEEDAQARLQAAAEICRTIPNRRVGAQVMHRLGEIQLQQGDGDLARESFAAVLAFAGDVGDRTAEAYGLLGLGLAHIARDEPAAARTALVEAERMAGELAELRIRVRALLALSSVALAGGDVAGARERAEEALDASGGIDLPVLTAACLTALGDADVADGRHESAVQQWTAALDHLRSTAPAFTGRLALDLERRLGGPAAR
ncbi:BTAD domain-containing putative transcriptional regulator [Pseudonocardia petroleophila]|uniref:Winged helix-turn-helix domain-containing protein n=1 Tax=Pseudonocardia petroleophila TaxID=37331 RepID=A0A7G7MGF1_9PSEU|nr:AfsR/SARP family transcriptional regulator [Pseudonocardia petroleophila]QNG51862.1 winged helix-turn-helix domain-containing protein [Pseudonocardia petroleophila]